MKNKKSNLQKVDAVTYYRYSSHQQDSGNSLSAQKNAVRNFAKENNIKIIKEFTDKAKTGTNTNREGYQQLLNYLEKNENIKCVLIHVLDRMHRNVREQLNSIYELKGKGIRVLTTRFLNE